MKKKKTLIYFVCVKETILLNFSKENEIGDNGDNLMCVCF